MDMLSIDIDGKIFEQVFFRHNTQKVGHKLGLTGFVRNVPNGNVEIIAEGDEEKLEQLIQYCKIGPRWANVENVEVKYEDSKNEFDSFSVR